ncbi:transposase domain-containing protein [Variovorax paradoxus]|uniref:transposase domain-containing protein n=1 Tax=Variovorax paradoxus TaxID=34073 RepID=UPI003F516AD9
MNSLRAEFTSLPGSISRCSACRTSKKSRTGNRKNDLHLGPDNGGHSAAVIYTLIGSAMLVGIDAQAYLRHVLERIAGHPSNRIDELQRWAVASELAKAAPTSSPPIDRLAASAHRRWQNRQHACPADRRSPHGHQR